MNLLSSNDRKKIYRELLMVANHYYFLYRKKYLVIDEELHTIGVSFTLKDFAHLTGIDFNFNEYDFYPLYLNGHLRENNINLNQKYSKRTIKQKLKNIMTLHEIFAGTYGEHLLLKKVNTSTRNYPYGIVSLECVVCLDKKPTYHGVSIRNTKQTKNFDDITSIVEIWVKETNDLTFENNVYIKSDWDENLVNNDFRDMNQIVMK